jgi:phosphoglycolate phosphatase-like HAD superfamily hydrolase
MSYKEDFFDLDETLLDTLTDIVDAADCALRSFSFPGQHTGEPSHQI